MKEKHFCQINKALSTISCIQLPQENKKKMRKLNINYHSLNVTDRTLTCFKGEQPPDFIGPKKLYIMWILSEYLVSIHDLYNLLGWEEVILLK